MTPQELAERFSSRPSLIHGAHIGPLLVRSQIQCDRPQAAIQPRTHRPRIQGDGTAVVNIRGALVSGTVDPLESEWFGIMGYDDIVAMCQAAVLDPQVSRVVLRIDSPGGEASGAFEAADQIHELGKIKPIEAVADTMAASAAYLLAAATQKITMTKAGMVGSIGVVLAHVDMTQLEQRFGIKVELIHKGERKVDGNPHEPLSEESRAELEHHVEELYELFVLQVAEYRGLSDQAVRDQESRIYIGRSAVGQGLADALTQAGGNGAAEGDDMDQIEDRADAVEAAFPRAVEDLKASAQAQERRRITAIREKASVHPHLAELSERAISEGMTLEAFGLEALDVPVPTPSHADLYLATSRADTAEADAGRPAIEVHEAAGKVDPLQAEWDASPQLRAEWADRFDLFTDFRTQGR